MHLRVHILVHSKLLLLLTASSEASQRVLKLNYTSPFRVNCVLNIPPGALACHEAENFLPEASLKKNLFHEELFTRGKMNQREPFNFRCTVSYKISRKDHWVVRSKWSNSLTPTSYGYSLCNLRTANHIF